MANQQQQENIRLQEAKKLIQDIENRTHWEKEDLKKQKKSKKLEIFYYIMRIVMI